jgi:hypothetical protein
VNDALGEIKDFSGSPDRALVGLVAGVCVITYGDFAARGGGLYKLNPVATRSLKVPGFI